MQDGDRDEPSDGEGHEEEPRVRRAPEGLAERLHDGAPAGGCTRQLALDVESGFSEGCSGTPAGAARDAP